MEEKKKNILNTASFLYLKYGLRSVTMDDVAREAGISKKTLYLFFKDKEDLVDQALDNVMNQNHYEKAKRESENAIDTLLSLKKELGKMMKQYNNNLEFELKKYYPKQYKKVCNHKHDDIFNNTVDNIKQGISEGLYRKDVDIEFVAKLHVGIMFFTMNAEFGIFNENEILSPVLFSKTMEYHLRALCSEKGLKYYQKQINKIKNEENN